MAIDPINFARTTQVRLRRGTTAQIAANPPVEAEPFYDATEQRMGIGGGSDGIVEQWKSQFLEHTADVVDAVPRNLQEKLTAESVSVRDFGAVGDGVTDDTVAFQNAISKASSLGFGIRIPAGTYICSNLSVDVENFYMRGDGSQVSVVKFSGSGNGLLLGNTTAFSRGINLSGITFEGNPSITAIIRARALAGCIWHDVNVREADSSTGVGIVLQGCMLSSFNFVVCSQNTNSMTSAPAEGLQIQALAPFGNSANNTFISCYFEGAGASVSNTINIGLRISGGTQNTFIGGSPEACKVYGALISLTSNYNTFIGTGFENLNATADVADAGRYTKFINCYMSQSCILQGKSALIDGGFYERIEISAAGVRNVIKDLTVNHWSTGMGGVFDSGTGTQTRNVFDSDSSSYLTDISSRFLCFVPSTVSNVTGSGTQYQIVFDEVFDDNKNVSNGVFTAPTAGRYRLSTHVSLLGLTTSATRISLRIVTSNRTFLSERSINLKAGGTQESISLSVLADMDAADTAHVTIEVSGESSDVVDIIGNVSTMWTTFSGERLS